MTAKLALLLIQSAVLQANQPTYAGAQACAKCHPDQSTSQSRSPHANALYETPRHPKAANFPLNRKLTRKPNYTFAFLRKANELHVRIDNQADVMELPLEWAFGAG